jgi:hypothetical protein
MRTCIYCRAQSAGAFPKEHVVPKAFGRFRENLTLDCVCGACNDFFNKELELFLTRDSAEAMLRVRYGLKTKSGRRKLGKSGSAQESVNTCVFAGFLSVGWRGHPRHRILSTRVLGNAFKPFVILFMSSLVAISFYANSLKGWLRGLARYKTASPKPRACLSEGIAEVCRSSG